MAMEHAARGHLRYSASGAHRWCACPGQLNFCDDLPPLPPTEWAIEGTRKHEELEFSLDVPGMRRPDEPEVDTVIQYVWQSKPEALEAEAQVSTMLANEEVGGTLDAHWQQEGVLVFLDAKFGFDPVEVENNIQIQIYALARLRGFSDGCAKVRYVIAQPSAFHPDGPIRTWEATLADLKNFREYLFERIEATKAPDAPLIPGKHCKYCPGGAVCPAREKAALAVVNESYAAVRDVDLTVLPVAKDLSVERLAKILAGKDVLEKWLNACEEQAKFLALQGIKIPGKKLVPTQSRRKWIQGDKIEIAQRLAKISGKHYMEFLDLVGITEAETKIAKEYREEAAFLMDKKPSGKLTLVDDADGRDAVSPTQNAFDGVIVPAIESQADMPAPLWPGAIMHEPSIEQLKKD